MNHKLIILFLLVPSLSVLAQTVPYAYHLKAGEEYFIEFSMIQQTETEQPIASGIVSLDMKGAMVMKVASVDPGGTFDLNCRYENLHLGFFSPQSEISISSGNKAFRSIQKYLSQLEEGSFRAMVSSHGKILDISGVDSLISELYFIQGEQDRTEKMLIRTIDEAFGETSLRSLMSITIDVYDSLSTAQTVKEAFVTFNASSLSATNRLYFTPADEERLRIQGVGVIHETIDSIEHEQISLVNLTKGSQTFDMVYNLDTGWIMEGISKQRIQTLGIISRHATLPEGLKIPSYTETEFVFKGGKHEE